MKTSELQISEFRLKNIGILTEKVNIYVNQEEGKLHIDGIKDMRAILHIIEVLTELKVVAEMAPARLTVAAVPVSSDLEVARPSQPAPEQPDLLPKAPKPTAGAKSRTKPASGLAPGAAPPIIVPYPKYCVQCTIQTVSPTGSLFCSDACEHTHTTSNNPPEGPKTFPERLADQVALEKAEEAPASALLPDLKDLPPFEGELITEVPVVLTPAQVELEKVLKAPLPTPEIEVEEFQGIKYPQVYFDRSKTLRDRVILLYHFGFSASEIKTAIQNTQVRFKVTLDPKILDNAIANGLARIKAEEEDQNRN